MKRSEFAKQIEEIIVEILSEENAILKDKEGNADVVDLPLNKLKTLAKDPNIANIKTTKGQKIKGQ